MLLKLLQKLKRRNYNFGNNKSYGKRMNISVKIIFLMDYQKQMRVLELISLSVKKEIFRSISQCEKYLKEV